MTSDAKKKLRIAALLVVIAALFTTGMMLERSGKLHADVLAAKVEALGLWAVPAFFLLCIVGELLHLPGMLFVFAAQLAFGKVEGFVVAYFGVLLGVSIAFAMARTARGKGDAEEPKKLRWAWANKLLARLDEKPLSTIFLLRSVFWISPPLNYALGLSRVKPRDYFVASALGLFVPILLVSIGVAYFKNV